MKTLEEIFSDSFVVWQHAESILMHKVDWPNMRTEGAERVGVHAVCGSRSLEQHEVLLFRNLSHSIHWNLDVQTRHHSLPIYLFEVSSQDGEAIFYLDVDRKQFGQFRIENTVKADLSEEGLKAFRAFL